MYFGEKEQTNELSPLQRVKLKHSDIDYSLLLNSFIYRLQCISY